MADTLSPAHLRIFVAIAVPEAVKAEIERAQAELRDNTPKGLVRWTRREQFHLTLRFLGNVEARQLDSLIDTIRKVCDPFPPLQLTAERIGFFPAMRIPRVLWVSVDDSARYLERLQQSIAAATQPFTLEKPEEAFAGHITLGRIARVNRPQADQLSKLASSMADRAFGTWRVDHVEVMRSELSPSGALHTCLAEIPLLGEDG